MKHIHKFESFLNETYNTPVSGTKAGSITSLDHKKYELKQDVKGAKIGSYSNVVLPKGTLITNNPGGVFANHDDLKKKYCTGYKSERWDSQYGVMITQMPDTLEGIEKNSKVLESDESVINEGIMSLTAYYKDYDRDVTTPAKKIDDILNKEIKSVSIKNAVLDLITDLVDEYAVVYSDNQKGEY